MTECNGCGSCCDPVVLHFTQEEYANQEIDPADKRWILEDLTPMPRKEAKDKEPDYYHTSMDGFWDPYTVTAGLPFFYSCKHFDAATRECLNYEHRPPMCLGYPWHGKAPNRNTLLFPKCSFREDIGQLVQTSVD